MDEKQNQIIELSKKVKKRKNVWKLIFYFGASFVGLFAVNEVFEKFNIYVFEKITNPFIVYLLISIIITLIRFVFFLIDFDEGKIKEKALGGETDSLIEMLKDAETHSRWNEIIKIGSALSDVLWFTSRKKLRVTIGQFVEVAASQIGDYNTLATTLIEDLGNTTMGLGDPDKGIEYIERGVKIAEEHDYYFLMIRGYRNLANCYSMKNDVDRADSYIDKADDAVKLIEDEPKRLEAMGGIEYARSKVFKHGGLYSDAISALDTSIQFYEELGRKYPDTQKRNLEREVKVFREKGMIYYQQGKDGLAKEAFLEGLRIARDTINHENIVRCCTMIAIIQIKEGNIQSAEGLLNLAQQHIDKIDTPTIISEYEEALDKFELAKARKNNGNRIK